MPLKNHIHKLIQNTDLTEDQSANMIETIMSGSAPDATIAAALTALTMKGETVDEIVGAAKAMRKKANSISAPSGAIDCCGTGGDGIGTYNISTAVAFITAACGIPVAKHGNRSASSKSGAADTLEAAGVNLNLTHEQVQTAINDFGFAFLMAPNHHSAMKHVAPIRKQLGFRTIFNILGPLANPAGTKFQLIGVYSKQHQKPMAEALHRLGTEKAWIVHGEDGLDEITTTGKTFVVELDNGIIREFTLSPEDFGLQYAQTADLIGGDAIQNATALLELLEGKHGAYRDIALANAAATLIISRKETDLKSAVSRCEQAIDNEHAIHIFEKYKNFTAAINNGD